MKFILAFLALPLALSCSSQKSSKPVENTEAKAKDFNNATEIVYHFRDSSVPPQYHRSKTYRATPTKLHYTVDSYGDIIENKTVDITPEHWQQILKAANTAGLKNKELSKEEGCTGGTGRALSIHSGTDVLFEGNLYLCGGSTSGNMVGDYESVLNAMTKGVNLGGPIGN